ncbi:MAG: two-component regulator propeller domain-containing protein [Pedobacter sp.]|uniref:ligand-binding sensor domain-containing protein n=1 Tax=Pedobacter sp. TaxID=1411316 RepID=UPI002807FD1A|nr:two-component regulator propeller domain-containing protein [Pedobacter sp.]MDQ8003491.1 two-component regulator propeller domain-containing protein [Pedobacter sp.]
MKKKIACSYRNLISTLLLLLLGSFTAIAQSFPNLKFNQITVKDGLSTNAVKCTYEDRNGIIWVATSKGLNRYDGTGVKEYKHNNNDTTTICNDALNKIVQDRDHHLWLGTAKGLSRFNPITGKATNFFNDPKDKNSLAADENCVPFVDSKGNLWLATTVGIQLFNYKSNRFTNYVTFKKGVKHSVGFHHIAEDREYRLWALGHDGLYLIDQKNRTVNHQKEEDHILALHQTSNGSVYLGEATNGLKYFEKDGVVKSIDIPFKGPITRINSISEWTDNLKQNWLCVAVNGGLVLKNLKNNQIKAYVSDELNPSSLNAFTIFHIAKDSQNRLWLSTDNGISIVDPNYQNFENIPVYQQAKLTNPKLLGIPNNMLETEDRFYITCYYAKGIYAFDKSWRLLSHIPQVPENSKSFLSKSISSIYQDSEKNLWFSTDSGLVRKTGNSYKIFLPPLDLNIKENLFVSKLYKREDGKFWIRARQNGIYVFDPKAEKFIKHYPPNGKSIEGSIYSCLIDKQGDFWIGGTKGISLYDKPRDAFTKIIVKDKDGKIREVTWVTDIAQDKEKTIWAVSEVGLLKIDKKNKTGLLIDHKMGLPENNLKRIMVDTLGYLWLPSQQGIIKYDRKKTFTYFNFNNGLPFQYEGHGFFEPDRAGNYLLSYSGYVTRFNPYYVKSNTAVPKVIFMDISADGQDKQIETKDQQKIITLKAGTKIVNIHFAITSYTATQENKFFYKVGKEADWQQVKNGDIALGSMPHGEYTLHVKGCNNDEVYSLEEQLLITVLPFWYEKNWFIILCISLVILIVVVLLKRRIAFIQDQFLFRQRLSQSELKAIRSQMNPHFIFNVLNSIESYIMDNDKNAASRLIQKFASLSRLVLENSSKSLVTAEKEWKALILYTELEVDRYSNSFTYTFKVDDRINLKECLIPPMLIQPLIENAILHGLIESQNADNHLDVRMSLHDGRICIAVEDNGVGVNNKKKSATKSSIKETSIGLSSIKERIEMLNIQDKQESASFNISAGKDGRGTIATICLPVISSGANMAL